MMIWIILISFILGIIISGIGVITTKAKGDEYHTMHEELVGNGLYRYENKEVICYNTNKEGGLVCKWK